MGQSLLMLFNHAPTDLQLVDARRSLQVENIVILHADLSPIWNSVPPELEIIEGYLEPIRNWMVKAARPGDYVLIQGDFGATFLMVKFAFERGLIPVYSTTERVADEEHGPDGRVRLVHNFRHVRYRKYGE
jgi:hypothetical protein